MDLLMTCFLTVGILFFVYSLTVIHSLKKKANKSLDAICDSAQNVDVITGIVEREIEAYRSKAIPILNNIKAQVEIPISAHMLDAGINFMAHIGASDLGKGGLGLDKEQIGRVTMARNGFNVVGKRVGDGIGVPAIMEKVDQFGGYLPGVQPGGPGPAADGAPNLGQLLISFLMGQIGPGIPGGGPGTPPQRGGGLPPL